MVDLLSYVGFWIAEGFVRCFSCNYYSLDER